MKITVSQARPGPVPPPIRAIIGNPGIAAVLDARAAAQVAETPTPPADVVTEPLPLPKRYPALGLFSGGTLAKDWQPPSPKLHAAFLAGLGLEPKSVKLFPQLEELLPRESKVAVRVALGELEKAAQEAVGKSAFEAGVFVLGAPGHIAKLTDGTLTVTARLAAGGKLAAGGVKAIEPFVPALAPNAPVLRDALLLLTVPDALGQALDPDQPAFRRLTAAGKLLATGAALAAHFVPALSAHATHISTIGWLCDVGDKTYAAVVEEPKLKASS